MTKLSDYTAKLTGMKGKAVRVLAAATLAGAFLTAASPKAQAQHVVIGIGGGYYAPGPVVGYYGGPAYGQPYSYGQPYYGDPAYGQAYYYGGNGYYGGDDDDDHRGWGDDRRGWGDDRRGWGDDRRGWGGEHRGWGGYGRRERDDRH